MFAVGRLTMVRFTARFVFGIFVGVTSMAQAADLVVTRYDDPAPDGCQVGDCSLREAIIQANAGSDMDRIHLSQGLYELSLPGADEDAAASGDLDILEDLDIVGTSALTTIVRQTTGDRVFEIRESTTNATLSKLRITGGNSDSGAGVRVARATVLIEDCEVTDNTLQTTSGGAVDAILFADVTLRRTTVLGGSGRAAFFSQVTGTMENVTLIGSTSEALVVSSGATASCQHCTIVGDGVGNDVTVNGQTTSASFVNTVVDGTCVLSDSPMTVTTGGNFETPGDTCAFDDVTDRVNQASADLMPLGISGGAVRTFMPDGMSLLIDTGQNGSCLPEDQTGFPRPFDGDGNMSADCDRGAVEVGEPRPAVPIFLDGFQSSGTGAWSAVVSN
jgi:hypothetical protein